MHANCRQAIYRHVLQVSNEGENKELTAARVPLFQCMPSVICCTNCGLMLYLLNYFAVHIREVVAMLQFLTR